MPNNLLGTPSFSCTVPQGQSFSFISWIWQQAACPSLRRLSCHSFERKILGKYYTLPNIWAEQLITSSSLKRIYVASKCSSPLLWKESLCFGLVLAHKREDTHGAALARTTHFSAPGQVSFQLLLRLEVWLHPYKWQKQAARGDGRTNLPCSATVWTGSQ